MRYLPLLLGTLMLTACGINAIPEASDIKSSLEAQFGGCKYVKISDVKKLNGRDLGDGKYGVDQEFTLELLPQPQFKDEAEKMLAAREAFKRFEQEFKAKFQEKTVLLEAEATKADELSRAVQEKYGPMLVIGSPLSRAEQDKASVQYDIEYKEVEKAVAAAYAALNAHRGSLIQELKNAAVAAGYPQNAAAELDKQYNEVLKKMTSEFDSTCTKLTSNGKTMVLQTAGLGAGDQMASFIRGTKKSFSGFVVYMKTEKGWVH